MILFPNKKYQIIYADPPWSYKDKAQAGNRGASFKYETQGLSWIQSLPVEELADENCWLFLWITMPQIYNAFSVMDSWGFRYITNGFTWIKMNKKTTDTVFWGMGSTTRGNAELCLIGKKGKPKRYSAKVHSVVHSPIRSHSEKPDEIRKKIVELAGDLPRIELFARKEVDGWDCWGNEVNNAIHG